MTSLEEQKVLACVRQVTCLAASCCDDEEVGDMPTMIDTLRAARGLIEEALELLGIDLDEEEEDTP